MPRKKGPRGMRSRPTYFGAAQQQFDNLSPAEAAPYEEEAAKDLRRYQEACEAHKAKKDELLKATRAAKAKVVAITKELKELSWVATAPQQRS